MITGKTLAQIATTVTTQEAGKRDFLADTRQMSLADDGKTFRLRTETPTDSFFSTRPNFHAQLGERTGIPARYYQRMQKDMPGLLATNVNTWLEHKPERRMVRTLDGQARAFLSDRFKCIDNLGLVTHVLPIIGEAGAQVKSAEITETRLYIQAIFPRVQSEVKVGDVVQSGVIIQNSEVGRGALSIAPLVYRLVCKNGLVVNDMGTKRYHVGRVQAETNAAEAYELFSDDTRRKTEEVYWQQTGDLVKALLDPKVFETVVDKLRAAAGVKIGPPQKAVEVTAKHYAFDKPEADKLLEFLIEGGDLSLWGLANACTQMANDHDDYDRAVEFERIGGQIVELKPGFFGSN